MCVCMVSVKSTFGYTKESKTSKTNNTSVSLCVYTLNWYAKYSEDKTQKVFVTLSNFLNFIKYSNKLYIYVHVYRQAQTQLRQFLVDFHFDLYIKCPTNWWYIHKIFLKLDEGRELDERLRLRYIVRVRNIKRNVSKWKCYAIWSGQWAGCLMKMLNEIGIAIRYIWRLYALDKAREWSQRAM